MDGQLLDIALQNMSSQAFEDLVYALVDAEDSSARQLRPPDGGGDTIVPKTEQHGELIWQAKRHSKGISWSECRKSVKTALKEREPEEITFVFPVNMTKTDEASLTKLRADYEGQVVLPEPWSLATLRKKLAKNPDIQRDLIERPMGINGEFDRMRLERLAGLEEGWDTLQQAAMRGPLAVLGIKDEFDAAEAAADAGDPADASARFEALAGQAEAKMTAVADGLLLRAANLADQARERARAGELYLRVSRSAAIRGDNAAEYAAFRASWLLDEDERWRTSAATARAVWTERPEEAIQVLLDAFDRSVAAGDPSGVCEWGATCCEALCAEEQWQEVVDLADRADELLGPIREGGERLSIELDRLEARSALGDDVEGRISELLLTAIGREAESSAWIRARLGVLRARLGDATGAISAFVDAADRWVTAGDCEDEIAEAVFSQDAGSRLTGGEPLDQPTRIAAADLRGRTVTAAVRADRKEVEGLRALAGERYADALRELVMAWAIHRRAGHLGGCARLATMLCRLCKRIEDWSGLLTWAIRHGDHQSAREAAAKLTWPEVFERVMVQGASWERGASFEAIAVAGGSASDEDITSLVKPLLAAAAGRDAREQITQNPAPAARRALSTILCGILDEDDFEQALEEIIYEIDSSPYPPGDTAEGVMLATEAGRCEQTMLLTELACVNSPAHVRALHHAPELIARFGSSDALDYVAGLAERNYTSLVLAAELGLPDERESLAARAAGVTARLLAGETAPEEIVTHYQRGLLGRWASAEDQAKLARQLVEVIEDTAAIDPHRWESAHALQELAPGLEPELASEVLDWLLAASEQVATPSSTTELRSHANPHLARTRMHTPAVGAELQAAALEAVFELAVSAERTDEVRQLVLEGAGNAAPEIRLAAVRIADRHTDRVGEFDLLAMLDDADEAVRAAALGGCVSRGLVDAGHSAVSELSDPDVALAVRASVLRIARESPQEYRAVLQRLEEDPVVYIRAAARQSLSLI